MKTRVFMAGLLALAVLAPAANALTVQNDDMSAYTVTVKPKSGKASDVTIKAKASVLMPVFLVIGLALIAMPGYKEERIARGEDISGVSGVELITPRWWAVLAVALVAGFGNFLLLLTAG